MMSDQSEFLKRAMRMAHANGSVAGKIEILKDLEVAFEQQDPFTAIIDAYNRHRLATVEASEAVTANVSEFVDEFGV